MNSIAASVILSSSQARTDIANCLMLPSAGSLSSVTIHDTSDPTPQSGLFEANTSNSTTKASFAVRVLMYLQAFVFSR